MTSLQNTLELLGTMGNVCRVMVETEGVADRMEDSTKELCLSVLTAAALLYDHVSPTGESVYQEWILCGRRER